MLSGVLKKSIKTECFVKKSVKKAGFQLNSFCIEGLQKIFLS